MTAKIRLLLREMRTSRELSQEELARALNLSRQSIISLEQGEYLPSSPVLLAMMEFFNCQLPELIEGIRLQPIQIFHRPETDEPLSLTSSSPFQVINTLPDDMDEPTFESDWSPSAGVAAGAMNIHETDQQYEIELQAPGYTESELNLEISDSTLTISGTKKTEDATSKNLIRREWQHDEFSRSIRFTTPIEEDKVEAKLTNGTLLVTAPKIKPPQPTVKRIEVKKK